MHWSSLRMRGACLVPEPSPWLCMSVSIASLLEVVFHLICLFVRNQGFIGAGLDAVSRVQLCLLCSWSTREVMLNGSKER